MKKSRLHKPLRRCKPLDLPMLETLPEQDYLIQFSTGLYGGYAINNQGWQGEFAIIDL
ncbi:hypothetical protein SAMN05880558_107171 [Aeromonas sp. RU39B]|jgi:hypothetical protein|uniref:hypothetical protein n=1 Tax=Aeromonas sp. RU39B TaxID=1907416 RepID=UPI0009546564|nr:hypothetical protein [Aeromonas sp. RU39B]SIQ98348.1 hypothetical protein SAMN05880558_107171 [Aeromonas sp. RU39B]